MKATTVHTASSDRSDIVQQAADARAARAAFAAELRTRDDTRQQFSDIRKETLAKSHQDQANARAALTVDEERFEAEECVADYFDVISKADIQGWGFNKDWFSDRSTYRDPDYYMEPARELLDAIPKGSNPDLEKAMKEVEQAFYTYCTGCEIQEEGSAPRDEAKKYYDHHDFVTVDDDRDELDFEWNRFWSEASKHLANVAVKEGRATLKSGRWHLNGGSCSCELDDFECCIKMLQEHYAQQV